MKVPLPQPRPPLTVLLVEDEDSVRRLCRTFLEEAGFDVLEAADGRQALHLGLTHSASLDLLLTDILLPDLDGARLASDLRGKVPGLKVLFMSGYDDGIIAAYGLAPGASTFLRKPFSRRELLEKVTAITWQPA